MPLSILGVLFAIALVAVLAISSIVAVLCRAFLTTKIAWRLVFGISVALATLVPLGIFVRFPPDPHINCHAVLDSVLDGWLIEHNTNAYPNVNGNEAASFAVINEYYHFRGDTHSLYGYVPGLKPDDPKELVLIYLKKMTRRTWNGDHSANLFTRKKWFMGGPDFSWNPGEDRRLPEGGQLVDTAEFKRRLRMTLEFLEENDRPHWRNVVKEHTAFLKSIE